MSKKEKRVKQNETVSADRTPKTKENPQSWIGWSPSWNFSICDFEHPKWSLSNSDIYNDIIPKLCSFERQKWSEITCSDGSHWIECYKFCKEAQERLKAVPRYSEYDTLFSLRLTGTHRLFGYIDNGIFFIIWNDTNHEICPSHKKHT